MCKINVKDSGEGNILLGVGVTVVCWSDICIIMSQVSFNIWLLIVSNAFPLEVVPKCVLQEKSIVLMLKLFVECPI